MKSYIEIKTTFSEEVEGTYIVDVEFNGNYYMVNCQSGLDHNYNPTWSLDCVNESGGDIADSGLLDDIREYLGSDDIPEDVYNSITSQIEECAEEQKTENTLEAVLRDKHDIEVKDVYTILGACFAPETSLYIAEHTDGKATVFCYDYTKPCETLEVLNEFDSIKEWKEYEDDTWFNGWNADGYRWGNISYAYFVAKKLGALDEHN